jgi:glycosyltransferase involved in cell wall biosynthesis
MHDEEGRVADAIVSVLAQTHRDLELIVVDDGSTDGSVHMVASIDDPRVRLIRQTNRGLAAARNAGLRAATGDALAFIDADDTWAPSKLGEQLDALRPGVVVYSDVAHVDDDGRGLGGYARFDRFPEDPERFSGEVHDALLTGNFVHPSTVLLRRADAEAVGAFREDLRASEDWEYWLRCARSMRFRRIDRPLATIRLRAGSLQTDAPLMRRTGRSVMDGEAAWMRGSGRLSPRAHGSLGLGYFASRNIPEAVAHLSRAALAEPGRLRWWKWLAASILWRPRETARRFGRSATARRVR